MAYIKIKKKMFIKSLPSCKYVNPLGRSYLKSNLYVSLTTVGYFQCYIYSHWLSNFQLNSLDYNKRNEVMFIRSILFMYVFEVHTIDMFSCHVYLHDLNITDVCQLFAKLCIFYKNRRQRKRKMLRFPY